MKSVMVACFLFFVVQIYPLASADELKLIERWNHGEKIFGEIYSSLIDKDGHVVVGFYHNRMLNVITPKEINFFATEGQGPGQITNFEAMQSVGNDIGVLEMDNKMLIFSKKGTNYVWKETLWFKRDRLPFIVKGVVKNGVNWYFTGVGATYFDNYVEKVYFIKVFQENRQPIKTLLNIERRDKKLIYSMSYYIAAQNDLVYYMPEHEFTVTVISGKDATIKNTVKLEKPSFYKPMPESFYRHKRYDDSGNEEARDWETWRTEYSRICSLVLDGNFLVLQVRTCDEKLKRYCLLFYNIYTFKLEKQIFSDDYFLGALKGKFYFYANGNPGLDEIPDICAINIYQFGSKKGK